MLCQRLRLLLVLNCLGLGTLASDISDADSFLSDNTLRENKDPAHNAVVEGKAKGLETCQPTGPIDTTLCDYETLEEVNEGLFTNLHELVEMPFFKYFQVDLYRECPFWSDDGQCNEPGCAITSVDESQIPKKWRAAELSKVEGVMVEDRHQLSGCYYRDSDFCFLDDNTEGEYYDLSMVPERYTGYSGHEAHRVWRAVYDENCFGLSEGAFNLPPADQGRSSDRRQTLSLAPPIDSSLEDEMCLEKKVYYKVISGLHASISSHICYEHLNQRTGQWGPNLQCFLSRLSPSKYPERLPNIYFNTVILLRAVARLAPYLQAYDYCSTGTHEDDEVTLGKLNSVIGFAQKAGRFDEKELFQGVDADVLKEEVKGHFRNVTRIMDCVGCDKCRLWGKVQTTGLATALKILFEMDENALDPYKNYNLLQRSEVVALINTLHRFSESLYAVGVFREMMLEESGTKPSQQRKPKPSPRAGPGFPPMENIQEGISSVWTLCKRGTIDCFVLIWRKALFAFKRIFTLSGKEFGPGGGEL